MARGADAKLRLTAQDRMSKHIKAVSNAFPRLTKAVRKTSLEMKKLERMNRGYNRLLSKTGKKMRQVGMQATVGLTAPIALVGAAAVRTAVTFEQGMNKVQAITQASGEDLEKMRKKAVDLGSTTAFTAGEAADAMAFLGQAGFKTNQIMSAIGPTLDLAASSGTDLARTADIMSNVMGGFNINAKESGRVADILAKTTSSANVDMEMIAETMKDAAPVAKSFGLSLEETAALTGKLGDAGIQGSKAGTTLKQMMLSLASPTDRIKQIMSELGVNVVDKTTGKMRSMTDILVDLNKGFAGKGIKGAKKLAVLNEIFGKRAIAGAGVLLQAVDQIDPKTGKAINTVKELTKSLEEAGGSARKMAEQRLKGLGGAFTKLGSAFEGFQLRLLEVEIGGKKLGDRLVSLIEWLTEFFNSTLKNNKSLEKWIVIIGGILAVIGPLIGFLGVIATILPTMITGFGMMAAALKFVVAPLMIFAKFGAIALTVLKGIGIAVLAVLSPVLLLKAAVVALAVGLVNLALRWNKIKNAFTGPGGGFLKGTKTFLGFGDDSEKKIPEFNSSPQGEATQTKEALQQSRENKAREAKASLAIQFSGDRQGTKILAEDRDGIIDGMTGAMGTL